jgi:hypothetical protein
MLPTFIDLKVRIQLARARQLIVRRRVQRAMFDQELARV